MIRSRALRVLTTIGLVFVLLTGCGARPMDALVERNLTDLDGYAAWLAEHRVDGVIGETGWPATRDAGGEQPWREAGRLWLQRAQAHGLPVYVWAAAPWWDEGHPLAYYRGVRDRADVSEASPQAEDFERALDRGLTGGVGLAEGTFGTDFGADAAYSSTARGRYGIDYTYPSAATLRYLSGRGIDSVRLAVTWERLQPTLGGPLDRVELERVRGVLRAAEREEVGVVLDLHNYGRYAAGGPRGRQVLTLGEAPLTDAAYADLWTKLATELANEPALTAYAVMNEPHDLPGGARGWEASSRAAVAAIRGVDGVRPIWVPGYAWSGTSSWLREHPAPWIPEGSGPIRYEAHHYLDTDHTGTYVRDYAAENARVAAELGRDR